MGRALFAVPFAAAAALLYGVDGASATDFATTTASSMATSSASGEAFANDRTYSTGIGMAPGQENVAVSGSTRDANGNRVIVNGMMGSSSMSSLQGQTQTGVGMPGATWGNSANATAIGNSLNVVVVGSWNTVIVDSEQINNGDQTANTSLNGKLNF
jgi:holdfast attachment protein HfaA